MFLLRLRSLETATYCVQFVASGMTALVLSKIVKYTHASSYVRKYIGSGLSFATGCLGRRLCFLPSLVLVGSSQLRQLLLF